MKKILLLLASMTFSIGISQDKPEITTTTTKTTVTINKKPTKLFNKNEIKFNALYPFLGAAELQYERILNEDLSVGARIITIFDEDINFNQQDFYLDGFYRFYFGKKPAAGFFIEGMASYFSFNDEYYNSDEFYSITERRLKREYAIGFGLQTGVKFITRQGLVFEISGGLGRSLIESVELDRQIYRRFGISMGYRF